ncbi:MAG: acyloxyacyl hydrolase [Bacteroidales bacterium]|nr:acyloxyacyl hydrolase [Bacteroidales bacterium]
MNSEHRRQSNIYMTFDVAANYQTICANNNEFDYYYNYPILGAGISVSRFSEFVMEEGSFLPDVYTVYGSFERKLYNDNKYNLGFILNLGLTTNVCKYDPINNPGNTFLSSTVMCYFGGGFYAKMLMGKHFELGLDFMYRHYSNGMLSLPNGGIDVIGAGVFVQYKFYEEDVTKIIKLEKNFDKGFQYHITLSGGVHSCRAEWMAYNVMVDDVYQKQTVFKKHPKLSLSMDVMYRYALKYASGISLDVFYSSNIESLKQCDRIIYGEIIADDVAYSAFSLGVALVNEIYYKNLAVYLAFGVYPYRELGLYCVEWHYEKAGLRYYFDDFCGLFAGFAIKAHSFDAEYFEFSFGLRY